MEIIIVNNISKILTFLSVWSITPAFNQKADDQSEYDTLIIIAWHDFNFYAIQNYKSVIDMFHASVWRYF